MVLLGIVFTPLACLDKVPSVSEGGRPVEAMSEGLPTRALGAVWCPQMPLWMLRSSFLPSFVGDALQEHFGGALAVEMSMEDFVALSMPD